MKKNGAFSKKRLHRHFDDAWWPWCFKHFHLTFYVYNIIDVFTIMSYNNIYLYRACDFKYSSAFNILFGTWSVLWFSMFTYVQQCMTVLQIQLKSRPAAVSRCTRKVFGLNFSNRRSINWLMYTEQDGNEKPTSEKVNMDFTIREVAGRI